ncbi:uncharacterized protein LOC122960334 isoform X2 [Acropora millepora]|uniref:uncharacterized protein LOC122960334 isoform X2 n=1 Tax=Acropora millepora TaxID=45264 RepID=UPI001CF2D8EA|nr:uncharacterized protein LOC122960334 isoform X2 [Acropora millepora]
MASFSRQPQVYDRTIKVTILASEWGSSKGGLSTINRELAIQLAKFSNVKVTFFLPKCSLENKAIALSHGISIIQAERGYEELDWLSFPPKDLKIDVVVGHGVKLGKQAQVIRESHKCKWVQVVHTDPEKLGMYKCYENPIAKGEQKHSVEVELCQMSDLVVGVGPKLTEAFRKYLRWCKKDQNVFEFTPGVFADFASVEQAHDEREDHSVLVFGRGDDEDFELKGFDIAARSVAALPDTHLVFVGAPDGKEQEIAKRLLDSGIPKERLTVRGFKDREALKREFCEADLVLMPSRTEGFGLTALEAMSAGLPVIVSKNSGFGEALDRVPFGSSFVIDSEDPSAWTAAIKGTWDKDRRTRLDETKVLRSYYGKRYRWSEQCANLLEKMASLLENRQDASRTSQILVQQGEARRGASIEDRTGQPTIAQVTHQVSDLHIYREPVPCVQKALSPVEHDPAFEKISAGDLNGSLETNQERGESDTPAEEPSVIAQFDFSKLPRHIHPSSEDVYPMTATPRGLALIINNESFVRGSEQTEKEFEKEKLEVRQGSEKDTISLQRLFEALNFKVRVNRNVTEKQLLKIIEDVSKEGHSNYHCFVLCLMSHGKEGQFYCADGKTVCLKEIYNFFSNRNCETLKGKPKLFFIQACRGYVKDRGVVEDSPSEQAPQQASGENEDGPGRKFSFDRGIIPNQADMLMAYSTVSGYASFRNSHYGSRFVRCLVEVFQEKASHEDVLSMLTMVNDRLSKMGEIDSKQVGQPTSTLRKKVYFWPGL